MIPDAFVTKDGKHPISKTLVARKEELRKAVETAVRVIGGLEKVVSDGDTVIIKPNFNNGGLFPAASDPEFVRVVVEMCRDCGAERIRIMDSAGFEWLPTSKVFNGTGMTRVAKECGAELIPLDDTEVIEVNVEGGRELSSVMMYEQAFDPDAKMIWLPCMKTDNYTRFFMSLRLIEGFVDVRKKPWLHSEPENTELKIAELNKTLSPHLIIMDARKGFSSGGPHTGRLIYPNSILASGDRVTMDVEALKLLASYPDDNLLKMKIWEYPQIKRAVDMMIGAKSDDEIAYV